MRVDVEAVVRHACKACGCPELYEKGMVSIEFTGELPPNCLGEADWIHKENRGTILISLSEWYKLTDSHKVELIVHEICHCIDDYLYGRKKRKPHGKKWKMLMAMAGIPGAGASI